MADSEFGEAIKKFDSIKEEFSDLREKYSPAKYLGIFKRRMHDSDFASLKNLEAEMHKVHSTSYVLQQNSDINYKDSKNAFWSDTYALRAEIAEFRQKFKNNNEELTALVRRIKNQS